MEKEKIYIGEFNKTAVREVRELVTKIKTNNNTAPKLTILEGNEGTGRTDLLKMIKSELGEKGTIATIDEFMFGVTSNPIHYNSFDVLIIDDFQNITFEKNIQDKIERFIIRHQLKNKQIILSCNRSIETCYSLRPTLRKILQNGCTISIRCPTKKDVQGIIDHFSRKYELNLTPPVINFLASNVTERWFKKAEWTIRLLRDESEQGSMIDLETARRILSYDEVYYFRPDTEAVKGRSQILANSLNHSTQTKNEIKEFIRESFRIIEVKATFKKEIPGPVVNTLCYYSKLLSPKKLLELTEEIKNKFNNNKIRITQKLEHHILIEIPRSSREIISFNEILNKDTKDVSYPLAFGKSASGDLACFDLQNVTNLMITGMESSGKIKFIETLLLNLIIKIPPSKLEIVIISSNYWDLSNYTDIPHLALPMTQDTGRAIGALRWTVEEIENRLKLLKKFKCRNISEYQTKLESKENFQRPPLRARLILINQIEEILESIHKNEVERILLFILRNAESTGIYIIAKTNKISKEIFSPKVKKAFPFRLCFQVLDEMQSKLVLGTDEAKCLLGKGDMLFYNKGAIKRFHSAYIDNRESPSKDNEALDYLNNIYLHGDKASWHDLARNISAVKRLSDYPGKNEFISITPSDYFEPKRRKRKKFIFKED